ncbi:hypothetical protein Sjap_014857 [Stephania japonica]|uniref:Uncharacterized protein n=1 Tax=Stephania japonica TaxID=461633 RepID=A0AAP0III6_9MAGN
MLLVVSPVTKLHQSQLHSRHNPPQTTSRNLAKLKLGQYIISPSTRQKQTQSHYSIETSLSLSIHSKGLQQY